MEGVSWASGWNGVDGKWTDEIRNKGYKEPEERGEKKKRQTDL